MRIVQADSGSDSNSESRRKECPLFNSAGAYSCGRLRWVGADGVRRFTRMISSFSFRLSESESEPESACTIRVP